MHTYEHVNGKKGKLGEFLPRFLVLHLSSSTTWRCIALGYGYKLDFFRLFWSGIWLSLEYGQFLARIIRVSGDQLFDTFCFGFHEISMAKDVERHVRRAWFRKINFAICKKRKIIATIQSKVQK